MNKISDIENFLIVDSFYQNELFDKIKKYPDYTLIGFSIWPSTIGQHIYMALLVKYE